MSRSVYPKDREPESPSTMLLRELQGNDEEAESPSHPQSHPGTGSGHIHPNDVRVEEEEDDDGPSESLLYGNPTSGGDRTPRSPPTPLPTQHRPIAFPMSASIYKAPSRGRDHSPGPFEQPPSSSASGRSGSTSPGPSTISVYASGLEGADVDSSSTGASVSASPSRRVEIAAVPTFREPPVTRPSVPLRSTSGGEGSSKRVPVAPVVGKGYLDPPTPKTRDKGKGKEKAKNQGGRRYISVATVDEVDLLGDDEGEPDAPKLKVGLNAYERALWRWVNVEDLDGYLQEVSPPSHSARMYEEN